MVPNKWSLNENKITILWCHLKRNLVFIPVLHIFRVSRGCCELESFPQSNPKFLIRTSLLLIPDDHFIPQLGVLVFAPLWMLSMFLQLRAWSIAKASFLKPNLLFNACLSLAQEGPASTTSLLETYSISPRTCDPSVCKILWHLLWTSTWFQ